MPRFENSNDELALESDEFENGSFELESDHEFNGETSQELESSHDEIQELELAAELLSLSNEAELEQFLGNLIKRVGQGVGGFGKLVKPLSGVLKAVAKRALPFVGGALGSFIPIPGVGTALGSAIGSAASSLLELELQGESLEDQQFELAQHFVRLAQQTAAAAAESSGQEEFGGNIQGEFAAMLAQGQKASGLVGQAIQRPHHRNKSGHWHRHGHTIVLHGV